MENRSRALGGQSTNESFHFARIRQACQNDDPSGALTNLIAWIGAFHHARSTSSIEQFAREMGDPELTAHIRDVREARLSNAKKWSGGALLKCLVRERDKMLNVTAKQRPQDSEKEA